MPKQSHHEARCSGWLRINFDFFVHPVHGTLAFSHFAPIEMRLPRPGFYPTPSGLVVQCHSHYATTGQVTSVVNMHPQFWVIGQCTKILWRVLTKNFSILKQPG